MSTVEIDVPSAPVAQRLVAARYTEEALDFDCVGERLFGVLSTPPQNTVPSGTAMLIVVGGPQYRAGAHRQFVQLARALAADGHAVLRFDARGMGDAGGRQRSFEDRDDDIAAALGALRMRLPSLRRLLLFGLCDGASAILLSLGRRSDVQVDGVCLLNPWIRSEATLARVHLKHYYRRRLIDPAFWRKLLVGGVGMGQIRGVFQSWKTSRRAGSGQATDGSMTFQQAMASAWQRYVGQILLMLSDDDLTAHEFVQQARSADEWRGLLDAPRVRCVTLDDADHTLSTAQAQTALERALRDWLASAFCEPVDATACGGKALP